MKRVRRTIGLVTWLEKAIINTGWFRCIYDGSRPDGSAQDCNSPQFFTRHYQMIIDGQSVSTFVRFIYDYRDNWGDFYLSSRFIPDGISSREASCRKMLRTMAVTSESEEPDAQIIRG